MGAFAVFTLIRGVLGLVTGVLLRYPKPLLGLLAVWVLVKAAGG